MELNSTRSVKKQGAAGSRNAQAAVRERARDTALKADIKVARRAEKEDKRAARRAAKKSKKAEKIGTELAALSPRELVAAARQYEENKRAKRGFLKFGAGLTVFCACFGVFLVNLQNDVDASQKSAVINQISSRAYALSPVGAGAAVPVEQVNQTEGAYDEPNPLDADLGGGDSAAAELLQEQNQEIISEESYTAPAPAVYTAPRRTASYSANRSSSRNYGYSSGSASSDASAASAETQGTENSALQQTEYSSAEIQAAPDSIPAEQTESAAQSEVSDSSYSSAQTSQASPDTGGGVIYGGEADDGDNGMVLY